MTKERSYRHEYDSYHGKPENIKDRVQRTLVRRKLEKQGRVHKGDGKEIDHIDGNPRNNSAGNLRVVSRHENRVKGDPQKKKR